MISPRIKDILQRLTVDASFRQSFLQDPDDMIAHAELVEAERRAILRLRARLVTVVGAEVTADPPAQWP